MTVSRKQLRDVVIDHLRSSLANGSIRSGEWLRQDHLAAELGVSPIPVREAFKQLEAEGFLEHVPYHGVRVIEFSIQDVEDVYAVRAFLEGRAAEYAAQSATDEELAQLRDLVARMEATMGPDQLAENRELNRQFHRLLAQASGRTYLMRHLDMLWNWHPTMLWTNFPQTANTSLPERDRTDNVEHTKIVEALEARDPSQARHWASTHVEAAGRALVATLRASQAANEAAKEAAVTQATRQPQPNTIP